MTKYGGGDEFTTLSGRRVHVLKPRPEDVVLADVANALARVCRFGGHVSIHLSVAQHSVLVSEIVGDMGGDGKLQLVGLLHDASEAYVGDVISPLKHQLADYKEIERGWQEAIGKSLGADLVAMPDIIHRADKVAFDTEWRDCFPDRLPVWGATPSTARRIHPMGPDAARDLFLARYDQLTK